MQFDPLEVDRSWVWQKAAFFPFSRQVERKSWKREKKISDPLSCTYAPNLELSFHSLTCQVRQKCDNSCNHLRHYHHLLPTVSKYSQILCTHPAGKNEQPKNDPKFAYHKLKSRLAFIWNKKEESINEVLLMTTHRGQLRSFFYLLKQIPRRATTDSA